MLILFDYRVLQSGNITGVEVYARSVLERLKKLPGIEVKTVSFGKTQCHTSDIHVFCSNKLLHFYHFFGGNAQYVFEKKIQQALEETQNPFLPRFKEFLEQKNIVFFSPDIRPVITQEMKVVQTIHDLAFLDMPSWYSLRSKFFFFTMNLKRIMKQSHTLLAVSKHTSRSIKRHFPEHSPIKIAYPSLSHSYQGKEGTPVKEIEGIEGEYILCIASIQPRKNIRRLIEAHAISGIPFPLVICGREDRKIFASYSLPKTSRVIHIQRVLEDGEKKYLLRHACIFALPSLYEGFGLPLLESMDQETPVIYGNTTGMKECVTDFCGMPVNVYQTEDIAEKINVLCKHLELRKQLARQGKKRSRIFDFQWVSPLIERLKETI